MFEYRQQRKVDIRAVLMINTPDKVPHVPSELRRTWHYQQSNAPGLGAVVPSDTSAA